MAIAIALSLLGQAKLCAAVSIGGGREKERERESVKLHASLPAFVLHVTAGLELTTSHV